MSGLLHPDLLAELRRPGREVYWLLELGTAPTRLSAVPVASDTLGLYRPWVASWGGLKRALSHWRGGLQAPTMTVEIDDTGAQFTRAVGRDLRGWPAVVRLMSPNVPAAAYFQAFAGVVDAATKRGARVSLSLRQKDDVLALKVPKAPIGRYSFGALPPDSPASGKVLPWAHGALDTTPQGGTGAVKALYVDPSGYRYLVALSWDGVVYRVFSGTTLMATPADYSVVDVVTGDGRRVQLLDFVVDQGSADVRFDYGTPARSWGPAEALKRILVDLGWNDYHAAAFLDASAPVDVASFAAVDTVLGNLGLEGAYWLPPEGRKLSDVLRDWTLTYNTSAYWTPGGNLAVLAWELRTQGDAVYLGPGAPSGGPAILHSDFRRPPEWPEDPEATANRLLGRCGFRPSDQKWYLQRTVLVETGDGERSAERDLYWLPASLATVTNSQYLLPDGTPGSSGATPVNAATAHEAVDEDPVTYPLSDGNATYVELVGGGAYVELDFGPLADFVAVDGVEVTWVARVLNASGADDTVTTVELKVGGSYYAVATETGLGTGYVVRKTPFLVSPATGGPWTKTELDGARVKISWDPGTTGLPTRKLRVTQVHLRAYGTSAADVSPDILQLLSQAANRFQRAPKVLSTALDLTALDWELGTDVSIEYEPLGWGHLEGDLVVSEPWERRRHRLLEASIDMNRGLVDVRLEDVQDQLTTCWIWGKALVAVDGTSPAGDGMALLLPGAVVSMSRPTVKLLEAPAGIGLQLAGPLVQVLANCWPSDRWGTLIESAGSNKLTRSSLKSGTTGLTITLGSGTVAADADQAQQLYLDPALSGNVLLFTAGSPHVTEDRAAWPTTAAYTANQRVVVSFFYVGQLSWRLTRSTDGWYWNDSTGAWQAGAVDNLVGSSMAWSRAASKVIDVGSGTPTLTVSLAHPAGGTAGRQGRATQPQIDECRWASSPIWTDSAAAARSADAITIDNDAPGGVQVWPVDRGSWRFVVQPLWNASEQAAGALFYVAALLMGSEYFAVFYQVGTGWVFDVKGAGGQTSVWVEGPAGVPVRGGVYTIRIRYTSSLGEWGLAPKTLTLTVEDASGCAGASAEAADLPAYSAGGTVHLGRIPSSAAELNGYLIEARQSPFCWSDEEMGL